MEIRWGTRDTRDPVSPGGCSCAFAGACACFCACAVCCLCESVCLCARVGQWVPRSHRETTNTSTSWQGALHHCRSFSLL